MGLRHWVGPLRTLALLVALVGAAALVWLYKRPYQKIALEINGVRLTHTTLKSSAQGVVEEIGYTPVEADHVVLPADETLAAGEPIVMRLARYVRILHDGTVDDVYTHATTLGEALAAAGVTLAPHDCVHLNGHLGDLAEPLPPPCCKGRDNPCCVDSSDSQTNPAPGAARSADHSL